MFLRYFGLTRPPLTLSRRDWDRFISDRRRGAIAPAGVRKRRRVGDRVIAYDLKWLLAVFNWATVAGNGQGGALLERNPLKGLPVPRVGSPARAILTDDQYLALRAVGRRMGCQFELALVLAHETGHRIGAIRQLRWSDNPIRVRDTPKTSRCRFHRGFRASVPGPFSNRGLPGETDTETAPGWAASVNSRRAP